MDSSVDFGCRVSGQYLENPRTGQRELLVLQSCVSSDFDHNIYCSSGYPDNIHTQVSSCLGGGGVQY